MNQRKLALCLFLTLVFSLYSCTNAEKGKTETSVSSKSAETAPGKTEVANKSSGSEPIYEKAIRKRKCELILASDIVEVVGVPESEIKENLRGCHYSWKGEKQGSLYLLSLAVHKSLKRAKSRFAMVTKSQTAAEMKEARARLKKSTARRLEKESNNAAAKAVASGILDSIPLEDIVHEKIEGIGNEAAISNKGTLNVRNGNLTFKITSSDGEDRPLDRSVVAEIARRIVGRLQTL